MANFSLFGLSSFRLRSRVCEVMSRGCIIRTEMTARARRRVGFAMVVYAVFLEAKSKKRGRDIKDAWPPNLGEDHFRDCGTLGAFQDWRLPHLLHAMTCRCRTKMILNPFKT